jgi:acyl dehydratase
VRTFADPAEFAAATGEILGPSDWVEVDQARVDTFADATGDHQWIHVDPERARDSPFGGTIVHGFMTLSLLPELWSSLYVVEGMTMGVNYGLNKVRFPAPVPVGKRVRLTTTIVDSTEGRGWFDNVLRSVMEIEGVDRPACVVESIARYYG